MSYSRTYIPGDRLVDCERCGFTYRRSQMKREVSDQWKNLIVCAKCYDGTHPNDRPAPFRTEGKLGEIT